jgi:hypothetical protein
MSSNLARAALGLSLFLSPSFSLAETPRLHPRQFSNIIGEAPFSYMSCTDRQIDDIEQAWADILAFVNTPRHFSPAETLETRIFGETIGSRSGDRDLIESTDLDFP